MTRAPREPTVASAILLVGGIAALGVAFMATLYAVGIDGRPDDVILEFNGHVLGRWMDRLVATVIATVVGTAGVVGVLRGWRGIYAR